MSSQSRRLRAAHRIYLNREGAPTAGDRWFTLYLIAFFAGWYVLPVAYITGTYLGPDLAVALTAVEAAPQLAAGLTVLGIMVLWLGRVQGPVYLSPFMAHTLLGTDVQRRLVLLRPTLSRLFGISAVLCAPAAFGIFAMTHAGAWTWGRFPELIAAVFLGGLLLGLLAFLGQRLRPGWLGLLSVLGGLLAAVHLAVPQALVASPAGWFAALWSGAGLWGAATAWPLTLLAVAAACGLAALALIPGALDRLPAQRVLGQARRLSDAKLYTSTGSVNDAIELFRAKPRLRLSGSAVSAAHGLLSGLRRDVVATLRVPSGLLFAAVLIPAGTALLTFAVQAAGENFADSRLMLTTPVGVIGGLLLFQGTGSLTEGWRQLKNEFDAAALYGWSARSALARRVLWPALAVALLTSIGAVSVVLVMGLEWSAAGWAAALVLLALAARFFQSMRSRDIPVEFLAPTVLPGGMDTSAVKILIWLGDGILITVTGVLIVVVIPWEPGTLAALLGGMIVIALGWGWARTGQQFLARAPCQAR